MVKYTVSKKNLSEEVILKIKSYIVNNGLAIGDRLPTEQEMSEKFGVSRSSIREATRALNFLGIIESAPRRGLTVGKADISRIAEYMGFHFAMSNYPSEHLLQARVVIEIGALPYAMIAIRENTKLYKELLSLSDQLENEPDSNKYIEDDITFHRKIVKASGIEPLVAFNDLLQVFFARFRKNIVETIQRDKEYSSRNHRSIIEAMRKGKLKEAQSLLKVHLEYHEKSL